MSTRTRTGSVLQVDAFADGTDVCRPSRVVMRSCKVAQRVPVLGENHQLLMRRGRRSRDRAVAGANRRRPGPAVPTGSREDLAEQARELAPLGVRGRGVQRGDRGQSRMGGPRRPRRNCWTSRHRPWPRPCWKPSTSYATPPRRGRPASSGRIRRGAGCCAPNATIACGRRRCCSTCAMRSAPGWRGRAATATSGRRCCRLPLLLMPTAACRSRPEPLGGHQTGSDSLLGALARSKALFRHQTPGGGINRRHLH